VADGRDHVAPEALAGGIDHRGPATRRVAATDLVVRPQTHLIAPQNQSVFLLRPLLDRGVLILEPRRNRDRVTLVRPTHWLLRRHVPTPQVPARRRERDGPARTLADQRDHRRPAPQ